MPDTMQPAPLPSAYQLRVVVRGVSPLIWRRLLVPADTTIADLHAVLQIAFGWTDTHLHRFVVQGREYGIGYVGGPSFGDDPRRVRLGDLGLRPTERFTYHYDFTAGWCLDLRVEQIRTTDLAAQKGQHCPVCTGGRRAGPP
ncbi:MAG TPA: plasmid pRiA4b ORF-3 family protein, partial [Candidatus Limnocylindrales bacterium]|nr:plasmid pRiA4b ORF-3 family protein [Candidatus Limnocylindrales bacterium]